LDFPQSVDRQIEASLLLCLSAFHRKSLAMTVKAVMQFFERNIVADSYSCATNRTRIGAEEIEGSDGRT
jgi:hypothetical protein